MQVYLGSDGLGKDIQKLKQWIQKNGNGIVLIPNALDTRYDNSETQKETIDANKKMLEEVGFNVEVKSLQDYFDKYEQLKEDFDKYKACYVIGGNVFTLRKAMELSGFDQYIKEKNKKDNYLYAGYSAGICVLGLRIGILETADPRVNPYNGDIYYEEGLGIINYVPLPHYGSNEKDGIAIEKVKNDCDLLGIRYKTLKNGESIVEDTNELER